MGLKIVGTARLYDSVCFIFTTGGQRACALLPSVLDFMHQR